MADRDSELEAGLPPRRTPTGVGALRLLALLCGLIPLVVYGIVGTVRFQQIRQETELRLDRSVRIAREHALKVFETNETVLDRLTDASEASLSSSIGTREAWLHDLLKGISRERPQIHSIWILGADGFPIATDQAFPPPRVSALDRTYFQWHRQRRTAATYVSDPLIGRATGQPFFDMSRGRYGLDGAFLGIVSISLRPTYFESFHDELVEDEPDMAVTLFREDGAILTRWPKLATAPQRLGTASPVMARIAAGQSSGSANGRSSVDGRERLLRYEKVGGFPVYIGTGMDVSNVRKRWLQEMAWLVGVGLPPLLGLILAILLALRRTHDALAAAHDLTEEAQARRKVEEALLQAQKLEALGRLTGGVAHDFNNALMVISSNLFVLRRRHPDIGEKQTQSIGRAVEAATRLTRQLLAFSRRQALVPKLTRLQDLLPTFQDLLSPVLGSRTALSISVDAATASVVVDPAELELALINLAINARDAMPAGGRFEVQARNASASELPPGMAATAAVLVSARDTGVGIPLDIIDRVFEPFFTTKPVGEGTGLGLSQIYGLCQRAGGSVTIESPPRRLPTDPADPADGAMGGTVVRMFFKAAAADASTPTALPDAPPRRLAVGVLMAEDNDNVAEALAPVLEELGATVRRVTEARAALNVLAAAQPFPDLLISDVVMPGEMDGLQLAREVRRLYPDLPIVLMTGYATQIDAIVHAGFEVIPKPYTTEMLLDAIDRARAHRRSA